MRKKPKTTKSARVRKVVPASVPDEPEKAEIVVDEADPLYRELRIENRLEDENGKNVRLKPGAEVEVIVEAESKDTVPDNSHK